MSTQISKRLARKNILITGGTRGIGEAMANRFISEGAAVVITGRQKASLECQDRKYILADCASSHDIKAAVEFTMEQLGRIDVLVNNAGVELEKTLEETTEEKWDWVMDINLKALFLFTKSVLPHMRASGGGSIINLASSSAILADPGLAAYNVSKTAVVGLTRSVSVENAGYQIRCNAICPGWIETDMLSQTFSQARDPEKARQKIRNLHPIKRLGKPDDIANIALWLASDESTFVTGQTFTVDGGLTSSSLADPNIY